MSNVKLTLELVAMFLSFLALTSSATVKPEQLHIAFGDSQEYMTVSWMTKSPATTDCQYGKTIPFDNVVHGEQVVFVDGGSLHIKRYMHHAKLLNLTSNTEYFYRCGGKDAWSDMFSFITTPDCCNHTTRLVVLGDFGIANAQSLPLLISEAEARNQDCFLHIGDFGYDMDVDNGSVGDTFMNMIEPVAARVPYMTCVGNHEQRYNFSHYKNRFNMPKAGGDGQNMWFSYNLGAAHIIALDTEAYFFTNYGKQQVYNQFEWLRHDLEAANSPEARKLRPWIIVVGHKPMYCTSPHNISPLCHISNNTVRTGLPDFPGYGLEDILYEARVDLQFYAHQHNYERFLPVYKGKTCKKDGDIHSNPSGPVHIISGAAGNDEGQVPFGSTVDFTAFRSTDFGFTKLLYNSTTIHIQQVSVQQNGRVIDEVQLHKDPDYAAKPFSCQ